MKSSSTLSPDRVQQAQEGAVRRGKCETEDEQWKRDSIKYLLPKDCLFDSLDEWGRK